MTGVTENSSEQPVDAELRQGTIVVTAPEPPQRATDESAMNDPGVSVGMSSSGEAEVCGRHPIYSKGPVTASGELCAAFGEASASATWGGDIVIAPKEPIGPFVSAYAGISGRSEGSLGFGGAEEDTRYVAEAGVEVKTKWAENVADTVTITVRATQNESPALMFGFGRSF